MRVLFLLPVLMLGLIVAAWYFSGGKILVGFLPAATPFPTPAVEGATSVVLPEVNPVVHVSPPPTSIFAPAPAPVEQSIAPSSSFDAFRADYEHYFRLVEPARP